jgi:amino acid transporter
VARDEVRDPRRTVPRATYTVVIFAMVFYGLTAWLPVYMRRQGEVFSTWSTLVCPMIAGVGLVICLVMAAANFEILTGGSTALSNALLLLIAAVFIAGVLMAIVYRRTRPHVYAKIGRQ